MFLKDMYYSLDVVRTLGFVDYESAQKSTDTYGKAELCIGSCVENATRSSHHCFQNDGRRTAINQLTVPLNDNLHIQIRQHCHKVAVTKSLRRMSVDTVERLHLEVIILPVLAPDRVTKWMLAGLFYLD
jgi:hypothetical protein